MEFDVDPLVAVLVAGEVGFWMLLGAGLVARYLMRRRTAGAVLLVRWADQRFAHRFAGGPPPWRPPRSGRARVRYEWREWAKYALAWAIACAVLLGLAAVAAPDADTGQLWGWMARLSVVLVIWFVGWPLRVSLLESSAAEVRS